MQNFYLSIKSNFESLFFNFTRPLLFAYHIIFFIKFLCLCKYIFFFYPTQGPKNAIFFEYILVN